MKIIAFAGSNSHKSINKELVKYTVQSFYKESINLIDLNDFPMPIFSVDEEEKNGHPKAAHNFINEIKNADAIICSMAEHNGNFTTAFKNILDWTSRIDRNIFQNKPMLLMATSPGGYGGGNVLETAQKSFPKFGADIKTVFSLPKFNENFSENEGITNTELKKQHLNIVEDFKTKIS